MNPGVIVIIVCLFSDVFLFFFLGHWLSLFSPWPLVPVHWPAFTVFFWCLPWIIQCLSYSPKWSWRCSWLREILVKLGSWSFVMKTHGICDATCSIYVFALDPDISPLKKQKKCPSHHTPVILPNQRHGWIHRCSKSRPWFQVEKKLRFCRYISGITMI